jgi:hypothetical protein
MNLADTAAFTDLLLNPVEGVARCFSDVGGNSKAGGDAAWNGVWDSQAQADGAIDHA